MAETYTLSTKIMTTKGETALLTLSSPKARSFRKYGVPFKPIRTLDGEGNVTGYSIEVNTAALAGFLADMTGLDISDIDELEAHDFQALIAKVQGMINDPTGASN